MSEYLDELSVVIIAMSAISATVLIGILLYAIFI